MTDVTIQDDVTRPLELLDIYPVGSYINPTPQGGVGETESFASGNQRKPWKVKIPSVD